MNEVNDDVCLDYEERCRIVDEELNKLVEERYGVKKGLFHLVGNEERDVILKELKAINGVTIRQLVRVTGISKFIIEKA